jgi:serine/threonine-protein kinase mTOR
MRRLKVSRSYTGFKLSSSDSIHGSLLAIREILIHAGKFMDGRFGEVCEIVLRYKEHREGLVRRTVIALIPELAQFDPDAFVSAHLSTCMTYLLSQLKKEKERSFAYVAIGKVAIAVGRNIALYLDAILASITESLLTKGKGRAAAEVQVPVYQCISMLAIAVGPTLTKHMHELLDYMFAGGLTESLRQALVDLSTHIPPLLPTIQDRLLNVLSLILCEQPYLPPG